MTAERQLCDELLTCWVEHGAESPEFQSMVNHASTEFDTADIILTLTAICDALTTAVGRTVLGGTPEVRDLIRSNFPYHQEAPHA